MKKICSSIAVVLMFTSFASLAVERTYASTLKYVYPLANGDFVIAFDVDPSTCTSTASPKQVYVAVGQNSMTASGSEKLFAAALAALATRQTVSIAFDDATAACYINRLTVIN